MIRGVSHVGKDDLARDLRQRPCPGGVLDRQAVLGQARRVARADQIGQPRGMAQQRRAVQVDPRLTGAAGLHCRAWAVGVTRRIRQTDQPIAAPEGRTGQQQRFDLS